MNELIDQEIIVLEKMIKLINNDSTEQYKIVNPKESIEKSLSSYYIHVKSLRIRN